MKSKEQIRQEMFVALAEIQSGILDENKDFKRQVQLRLQILSDILGDDVPEEFYEQIEKAVEEI